MEELHTTEVSSKIADFKEIVTSFSELLTLENKALEEFDVETVSSLYERKAKTISAYRSLVAYFIKNQQELAALAEQERQEMKEISTRLDELIKTNEQLLKTRMETSKTSWTPLSILPRSAITSTQLLTERKDDTVRWTTARMRWPSTELCRRGPWL